MAKAKDIGARKRTVHRSPAFPFISLKRAIERAREFYDAEKRHPALGSVAASHWGFGPKSSGGLQTIGALKQFGLMKAGGPTRQVQLTDLGLRLVLDQRPTERLEALKKAALSPKIYAELNVKWGQDLPSDATIRFYLTVDRHFNENVVGQVIQGYKDTIAFSKLADYDKIASDDANEGDDLSDSQGDVEEVQLGANTQNSPNPSIEKKPPPVGFRRDVFSLGEGEAILQVPGSLSTESVQDLEDWLGLVLKRYRRQQVAESSES